MPSNVQIIILAAGSSSRMGFPKQSLKFGDTTLLAMSAKTALDTKHKVTVVTGANHREDKDILANFDLNIVYNSDWVRGMGNSLKKGVSSIIANLPDTDAILIMVCDQPKLSTDILTRIIATYEDGESLVACQYGSTFGVPALFGKTYFKDLQQINDKDGAKSLINPKKARLISFSDGILDVDTPEDYKRLTGRNLI